MSFTEQEQQIIKWGLANGKSQQEVTQAITNFRSGIVSKPPPAPTTESGGGVNLGIEDAAKGGINQAKEGYNQARNAKNPLELLEGGTKLAAGAINTLLSPLAPVGKVIDEAVVKPVSDVISDIPAVQKFANSKAGEVTKRVTEDIANLNTIVGAVAGAMELKAAIKNRGGLKGDIKDSGSEYSKEGVTGGQALNPDGTLIPKAAEHMVSDLKLKFNQKQAGLGDAFAKTVDLTKPRTIDSIRTDALNFIKSEPSVSILGGIKNATKNITEKVSPVVKSVAEGRDAKLLSIFSGESTDVVKSAISDPATADLGIKNGDAALRNAVQKGADSSIKARQSFTQAYGDAFKSLVKDNPGKIASRQKVLYKFVDDLASQGVKAKNGKLDFSTSKIVANPGEIGKINSAYEAIQNWTDFSLEGTNRLKQLIGKLTKFATEQGGSSKSPFLGTFYDYLDNTIKDALPEKSKKAYTEMNQKFSDTIGLYDEMVDAFNSGDPFTRLSQLFGANKDTLRQVIDFYEKTTGNKISPIVAGRTLAQEKSAAFGFLNPRSWVDFFIPPKLQAELVTGYGKLKNK